ncbi:hypothetical protein GTX14_35900 [Streptomyces sp. SID4944]|nr:hypothetical protein [Streptomyces sp. SID4944]
MPVPVKSRAVSAGSSRSRIRRRIASVVTSYGSKCASPPGPAASAAGTSTTPSTVSPARSQKAREVSVSHGWYGETRVSRVTPSASEAARIAWVEEPTGAPARSDSSAQKARSPAGSSR